LSGDWFEDMGENHSRIREPVERAGSAVHVRWRWAAPRSGQDSGYSIIRM
jgi:hypothetical protein